jgi:hypothetical protein
MTKGIRRISGFIREFTYPVGLGTFDFYAYPTKAIVTRVEHPWQPPRNNLARSGVLDTTRHLNQTSDSTPENRHYVRGEDACCRHFELHRIPQALIAEWDQERRGGDGHEAEPVHLAGAGSWGEYGRRVPQTREQFAALCHRWCRGGGIQREWPQLWACPAVHSVYSRIARPLRSVLASLPVLAWNTLSRRTGP